MTTTPYIFQNKKQTPTLSDVADTLKNALQKSLNSFVGKSIFVRSYYQSILKQEFDEYKSIWELETLFLSDSQKITGHWAYRKIIEMGADVLPYILTDMAKTNNHWFEALEAITGQNPVAVEHWGDIPLMVQDWLNWAKNNLDE